jgi:ATP-dependent Clp protease protease subunit
MRFLLSLAFLIITSVNVNAKEILLTKDNTLVLDEAFSSRSVAGLITRAKQMDADLKSGYPIYLFLNTPGGSIQAGLELIEALKGLNRPVHTITLFAASMGWQLLQHLGTRYVLEFGVLMSHKAAGGFSGEFGGGGSQIDSRYGLWLRRLDLMDKQTVARTKGKKTLAQYRAEYDNELWLNGEEAVKNGYADEVVSVRCSKELNGTKTSSINFFGMSINIEVSECPIITGPVSVKSRIRTNKGFKTVDEFLNEGGKFDKTCRAEAEEDLINTFDGTLLKKGRPAELCAADPELTLEKVQEKQEEIAGGFYQKKNIVKMNFSAGEIY